MGHVEYPDIESSDIDYFSNDKRTWIIAKADKKESVQELFKETHVSITVGGKKHLGWHSFFSEA